jgi:hypothetical protein
MNFQVWRGTELSIYDEQSVLAEEEEPMLHSWFVDDGRLVFIVGDDCELSEEEIEGRVYYSVTKKPAKATNINTTK